MINVNEIFKTPTKNSNNKFIFIRLLCSSYKNKLEAANILKCGIELVQHDPSGIVFNHAEINTKLTDDFYALTLSKDEPDLKIESITNTSTNTYLAKTEPKKSIFAVYLLSVTNQEYENIDKYLKSKVNKTDIKYDPLVSISIGVKLIASNFYSHESIDENKHYVCSTFVSNIIHDMTSTGKEMDKLKMDYDKLTPNDIKSIPGVSLLFSGTFDEYLNKLHIFLNEHPEFNKYI